MPTPLLCCCSAGGPLLVRDATTRVATVVGVTSHGPDCLSGPNYAYGYYTGEASTVAAAVAAAQPQHRADGQVVRGVPCWAKPAAVLCCAVLGCSAVQCSAS
jgi:hypothetical protein